MSFVEKFFAGAFGLIALFLLLDKSGGADSVLSGLANFNQKTFSTLQGR